MYTLHELLNLVYLFWLVNVNSIVDVKIMLIWAFLFLQCAEMDMDRQKRQEGIRNALGFIQCEINIPLQFPQFFN
jgi:hypothetical protein